MGTNTILTEAEEIFRNYGSYIIVGLMFLFLISFLVALSKRKDKLAQNDNIFDELTGQKEAEEKRRKAEEESRGYLGIEEAMFDILHIKPDRRILMVLRMAIVAGGVVLAAMFHYIAIYFVFEVFMFLYTKSKEKKVEDDNGLSYIDNTNRFLDMYIPSVSNGMAVNQVMNRFVENTNDEILTKWWYLDDDDKQKQIPRAWDQVIRIYYSGIYNEQNGFQDSAETFQADLIHQVTFYNNFKEKIGDITPIRGCYYIFMPIILIISYTNAPEFWSQTWGLIDAVILCFMLWLFSFLLSKLHKDTCEQLF